MIPNIKSSEGIGDGVLKKSYTCGLRVYHVQRASGNQYVYPFKSSVREMYPTA
jgi:hypothetical protein